MNAIPLSSAFGAGLSSVQNATLSVVHIKSEAGGIVNTGNQGFIDPQTGRAVILSNLAAVKYERNGVGVIISSLGFIVTNLHTVKDASRITVTFHDNQKKEAALVYEASGKDIAILRFKPDIFIPAIEFGNSDHLAVGEELFTIGGSSLTDGAISSGKVIGLSWENAATKEGVPFVNMIRLHFKLNPYQGDSGSPLLNQRGEFVGFIAAAQAGTHNPVYALPANVIKKQYLKFLNSRQTTTKA